MLTAEEFHRVAEPVVLAETQKVPEEDLFKGALLPVQSLAGLQQKVGYLKEAHLKVAEELAPEVTGLLLVEKVVLHQAALPEQKEGLQDLAEETINHNI